MLLLLYANLVFTDYMFLLVGSSYGMISKSSRQIAKENEMKGISVSGMLQIHPDFSLGTSDIDSAHSWKTPRCVS